VIELRGCLFAWKTIFWKSLSKLSCVCLPLEKLVNEKYFTVKEKFNLIFRKVFSFYFGQKHFSEVMKNIILFADYIKFCGLDSKPDF